jgi:hypothetical protein
MINIGGCSPMKETLNQTFPHTQVLSGSKQNICGQVLEQLQPYEDSAISICTSSIFLE